MVHRFQFNRKHRKPVVIEGTRVDIVGDLIIVVDEQGEPKAYFTEAELSSWYTVTEASS
jgi:hypothetical protein